MPETTKARALTSTTVASTTRFLASRPSMEAAEEAAAFAPEFSRGRFRRFLPFVSQPAPFSHVCVHQKRMKAFKVRDRK